MAERSRLKLFPGMVFLAAAAVLLAVAIATGSGTRQFLGEAAAAPGVVTALNAGGSHPEVEFTTTSGRKVSYAQGGCISGYKPGDRVRVLYRPADPHGTASIDAPGALWFAPGVAGLLALGFTLIGVASLLRRSAAASPA
jgi:hypothetical protein